MNPRTARPRRDALPAVGCNGGEFFYAPPAPCRLCSGGVNPTPLTNRNPLHFRDAILWGVAALAVSLVFAAVVRPNIGPSSDIWDYSQEARQLARGEGFTSLYTYPVHLGSDDLPPFPVRWRMPLYAARGALALRMGFPLPDTFLIIGAQSHAVLVAFVFLLGAHLHSRRAGALAAACTLACPFFLDAYSAGLNQVPAAAFGLIVWFLLLRGRGTGTAILAALAAAVSWYLRSETLILVPVWAWVASAAGLRRCGTFLVVFAALCAPWPIALAVSTGSAFPIQGNPMLLYTPEYPGYASARAYGETLPGALEYLLRHPGSFVSRWVKDLMGFGLDFLGGVGPIAVGLALAGLLLREARDRYAALRPTLPFVAAIAIQMAVFAALERSPRFLVPVVPLACVMVGIAGAPALDRLRGRRMLLAMFALLMIERGATVAFQTRDAARRSSPMPRETLAALSTRAAKWPKEALLLSDTPDWAAWHLDRPAVLLPLRRSLEPLLLDHDVAAIFLSPGARARNAADGDTAWVGILDRSEPLPGFQGPTPLPGGARLYVRDGAGAAP